MLAQINLFSQEIWFVFFSMNKNMRTCKPISAIIPLGTVTWYTLDNKTMKWKGSIGKRESARGSKVLKYFSQVLLQLMEKTGGKLRIIWPMGNESCFWPFLSAGAFVSGLSIRRCFLSAKETLTSSRELEGKLYQRFQIRFSLSLFRRFRRWFQRPQINFSFAAKFAIVILEL